MSLTGKLARFLNLSWQERRLLLRAFASLVVVDTRLRRLGAQAVSSRVRKVDSRPVSPGELELARAYAWSIRVAARYHFVRARCLHQSLVLHDWLRQTDLPSDLRIGVRMNGGQLAAHAWVELAGQVVNDEAAAIAPFTQLTTLRANAG